MWDGLNEAEGDCPPLFFESLFPKRDRPKLIISNLGTRNSVITFEIWELGFRIVGQRVVPGLSPRKGEINPANRGVATEDRDRVEETDPGGLAGQCEAKRQHERSNLPAPLGTEVFECGFSQSGA